MYTIRLGQHIHRHTHNIIDQKIDENVFDYIRDNLSTHTRTQLHLFYICVGCFCMIFFFFFLKKTHEMQLNIVCLVFIFNLQHSYGPGDEWMQDKEK